MKKTMLLSLLFLIFLMFFLTSCGTKPDEQQESKPNNSEQTQNIIEPEELISKEEAAEIMESILNASRPSEQKTVGLKLMFYEKENEDDYFQISITQQAFMPETQTSTPGSIYNSIKDAYIGTLEPLPEVGEEAYYEPVTGLSFLHDGYYVSIKIGKFSGTVLNRRNVTTKEMYIDAGKLAIKNLKEKLK